MLLPKVGECPASYLTLTLSSMGANFRQINSFGNIAAVTCFSKQNVQSEQKMAKSRNPENPVLVKRIQKFKISRNTNWCLSTTLNLFYKQRFSN